nr:MAG TPA: restriction alleviation protein [Bacteriophage sp.]
MSHFLSFFRILFNKIHRLAKKSGQLATFKSQKCPFCLTKLCLFSAKNSQKRAKNSYFWVKINFA